MIVNTLPPLQNTNLVKLANNTRLEVIEIPAKHWSLFSVAKAPKHAKRLIIHLSSFLVCVYDVAPRALAHPLEDDVSYLHQCDLVLKISDLTRDDNVWTKPIHGNPLPQSGI